MANDEMKLKFEYGNLKNILELFSNYRLMPIKLGAHETILVPDFYRPTKSLRVRHQFLRDFSRPIDIGQFQLF